MKTLKIYDPAMCCSSGVCGPNVNEKLVHLATCLNGLDKEKFSVERYNLSQQPEAYVANTTVAEILREKGADVLPLIFLDEKLVCSGDYPSIENLAAMLEIDTPSSSGDGCGCDSDDCCP